MMENGHKLIDQIINVLFTNEHRRMKKMAEEFIDRNQLKYGFRLDGFTHAGEAFNREGLRGALQRRTLHISLWEDMNAFLADRTAVEQDKTDIRQLLVKLIEHVSLWQELRDAIPDCITDCLPDSVRSMQRLNRPESFLKHPRDLRQFEKIMPKIAMYSASRLLY